MQIQKQKWATFTYTPLKTIQVHYIHKIEFKKKKLKTHSIQLQKQINMVMEV
jgi:hypothetical protein